MNNDTNQTNYGLNAQDLNSWLEKQVDIPKDTPHMKKLQTTLSNHHMLPAIKLLLTLKSNGPPSPPSSEVELPPLVYKRKASDEPLEVLAKRQRNTDAARRSRQRKAMRMEALENRVQELKKENEGLRMKVAVLESKIDHVSEREERNRRRVFELETQLAAVHQQLLVN